MARLEGTDFILRLTHAEARALHKLISKTSQNFATKQIGVTKEEFELCERVYEALHSEFLE